MDWSPVLQRWSGSRSDWYERQRISIQRRVAQPRPRSWYLAVDDIRYRMVGYRIPVVGQTSTPGKKEVSQVLNSGGSRWNRGKHNSSDCAWSLCHSDPRCPYLQPAAVWKVVLLCCGNGVALAHVVLRTRWQQFPSRLRNEQKDRSCGDFLCLQIVSGGGKRKHYLAHEAIMKGVSHDTCWWRITWWSCNNFICLYKDVMMCLNSWLLLSQLRWTILSYSTNIGNRQRMGKFHPGPWSRIPNGDLRTLPVICGLPPF